MNRPILIVFLSAVTVLPISCSRNAGISEALDISDNVHRDEITVTKAQFEADGMKLGEISEQSFFRLIKANGYIDLPPDRRASVSVKMGGFVRSLAILPGDRVKQGAVLFTLENPDFVQLQQDYLEVNAQLTYLKSDYERQKLLASENIASQKSFLKAEADYKVASARAQGLREKIKMLNIDISKLESGVIEPLVTVYSPINGYLSKVNITRGVFVAPADVAVEIVDTEHMHVELQVFEKDVAEIRKGQRIQFRVMGSPVTHNGDVYLVGKTIEGDTRTVNIHGHISDEDEVSGLLPGMYVEATIHVASVQRPVLPSGAVMSVDDKRVVLVLQEERKEGFIFRRQEVTTGQFNDEWTEIVDAAAFKQGTQFLVKGGFNLLVE